MKESIDYIWHQRLKTCNVPAIGKFRFGGGYQEQKKLFFEERVRNPYLEIRFTDDRKYKKITDGLEKLEKDILHKEQNKYVAEIYMTEIGRRRKLINSLYYAGKKDVDRFYGLQSEIYCPLKKRLWNKYVLLSLKRDIDRVQRLNKVEVESSINLLQGYIPALKNISLEYENILTSDDQWVVRRITNQQFGHIINLISHDKEQFNPREVKRIFEKAIKLLCLKGWRVRVRNIHLYRVKAGAKRIEIPGDRNISNLRLKQLLIHEICTHVLRADRGKKSKLKLLCTGLPYYRSGEEGVATIREIMVSPYEYDEVWNIERYLFAGLAAGIDGKKRDFREVYDIGVQYFRMKQDLEVDGRVGGRFSQNSIFNFKHDSSLSPEKLSFFRTARTFWGNTDSVAGVVNFSGLVYLDGRVRVLKHLHKDPASIRDFNAGKFDPSNKLHQKWLKGLNI